MFLIFITLILLYSILRGATIPPNIDIEYLQTFYFISEVTLTVEVLAIVMTLELISSAKTFFVIGIIPTLITISMKAAALVVALNVAYASLPSHHHIPTQNRAEVPVLEYQVTSLFDHELKRLIGVQL